MSLDEPPFHNIAIVGLGLIGGSIALAIRERWPSIRITAVDRPAVLAHAAGSGAIDRAVQRVADLGGNDLVILAAPVEQNVRLLPEAAATISDGGLITDVGGTKRDIVNAACALPGVRAAFVGGHPIGGAEQGGFAFARADLFRGRPWILTPNGTSPAPAVDRLAGFVESLGARPTMMDAEDHDRLMAFLSHLPQLTVSALMEVVGRGSDSERPATRRARPHGLDSTCVEPGGRLARSVRFERRRHRRRARSTDRALAAAQGRAHRCRDCRSCLRARRSLAIRADEGA